MAIASLLVDTSAVARWALPAVGPVLEELARAGQVATCGVIELEVGLTARNARELAHIRARRAVQYEWLETDDRDLLRALEVQDALAERGVLRAVRMPDLVIAAVAERHRVTVLHYDADFDRIADITGQPMDWVAPRGSI